MEHRRKEEKNLRKHERKWKFSKWEVNKMLLQLQQQWLENCESQVCKCLQRIKIARKKCTELIAHTHSLAPLPRTLSLVQSGCSCLSFTQPPCLLLYLYQNLLLISYFFRFLALFIFCTLFLLLLLLFHSFFFLSVRSSFSLTSFRFHSLSGVIPLAPILPDLSFTLHFVTHFFPLQSVYFPCLIRMVSTELIGWRPGFSFRRGKRKKTELSKRWTGFRKKKLIFT